MQLRIPFTRIHIGRFLFLFISLILMFVLRPFLDGFTHITTLIPIFFLIIFVSAVFAVSQKKRTFFTALFLALATEVSELWSHLSSSPYPNLLRDIFAGLLLAYTATHIVIYLFREKRVTGDLIIGAVCSYFLIGLAWSFLLSALETLQPGSFQAQQGMIDQTTLTYYSFITLTTVGYGDMTPVSSPARALSVLEAMMGQLYVAIIIARLVGIHITRSDQSG